MMNPHKITAEFEKALSDYTSAPYAVAVDNCSNALFLALYYELNIKLGCQYPTSNVDDKPVVAIPKHTYMSVPNEIIHAGGIVKFKDNSEFSLMRKDGHLIGSYRLGNTNVWDSALSFTHDMYVPDQHMCLSFTGPFKHLKLGKGGAILTDDARAAYWFKRARFSGRRECSYHEDDFDENIIGFNEVGPLSIPPVAGWNFYMMPEIAARGLLLMAQFYDKDGKPKSNEDLCLPYPDLSKFKLWQ